MISQLLGVRAAINTFGNSVTDKEIQQKAANFIVDHLGCDLSIVQEDDERTLWCTEED